MRVAIFGASGCARETADICLSAGYKEIVFIELNPKNKNYYGYRIEEEKNIDLLVSQGYHFLIGIGDNQIRENIYLKYQHLPYINIIHPSATFGFGQLDQLKKAVGNIVAAGVRFTNNIEVGNFGIYNLNATIAHDCILEDFINISPGVNISGNVHVSRGAFAGTNASILPGKSINKKLVIGRFAIIAAGAVVTQNVPDGATVRGVPAREV